MYNVMIFEAEWCGPCQELNEALRSHPINIPDVQLKGFDVDEDERLSDLLDICTTPTIVIMNDQEKEIGRHVGFMTVDQLEKFIKQSIQDEK